MVDEVDVSDTTNAPPEDDEPVVSFKLLVTIILTGILLLAGYIFYSGATGTGTFRKACEKGKGKRADVVLAELASIGGAVGEPSDNGTVIVTHSAGPRCVVRVTDDRVFSSIFEE